MMAPFDSQPVQRVVGRGARGGPANRFERTRVEVDFEQLADDDELLADERRVATEFLPDEARTLIRENDSPDIPFRYSVNAYRGCEHGCAYCYARPTHETLGLNAGLDFETRILVKHEAPAMLRRELAAPAWRGDWIAMSGVTDCYQPVERRLQLTRQCLAVMEEARQAVGIVTKNALVVRDLDLLEPMARRNLVQVNLSITTLDAELARTMEPRTSSPAAKLRAMRLLADAGVPTRVMVSPVIPGLTDHELPAILAAAGAAGARSAGFLLLRLPLTVKPVFLDWLERTQPTHKDRILARIRDTRGGRLSDAEFGRRHTGEGEYAEQLRQTFRLFATKQGLDRPLPPLDTSQFQRPQPTTGQQWLF